MGNKNSNQLNITESLKKLDAFRNTIGLEEDFRELDEFHKGINLIEDLILSKDVKDQMKSTLYDALGGKINIIHEKISDMINLPKTKKVVKSKEDEIKTVIIREHVNYSGESRGNIGYSG